ncbi:MAG: rhomboid family intramembrane serine protease [Bacteroidetes bacterium]|nr:rhomboid family intramembrane serine protease [Bacteroidota bacterium]
MDMFGGLPTVVKNLLIINVLMFLVKLVHPFGTSEGELDTLLGLHFITSPLFRPWQLITHMFMHGGFLHLLLNMFALFMLGPRVEYRWGSKRFLLYYMLCGLGAAVVYMAWLWFGAHAATTSLSADQLAAVRDSVMRYAQGGEVYRFDDPAMERTFLLWWTPMVGASGAIFGVLLAFGMLYPNVELTTFIYFFPINMRAKWFVIIYAAIELFNGVADNPADNTAHFAHLGGMLFGFFLVRYWERGRIHHH